jgi:hypothetical protein
MSESACRAIISSSSVGTTYSLTLLCGCFTVHRQFSEADTSFFLNLDFISHVALVAVVEEDGKSVIAGGGRYIVIKPGQAGVALRLLINFRAKVSVLRSCVISHRWRAKPACESSWQRFCPTMPQC